MVRRISSSLEFNPRTVEPVASTRYTYYAVATHIKEGTGTGFGTRRYTDGQLNILRAISQSWRGVCKETAVCVFSEIAVSQVRICF